MLRISIFLIREHGANNGWVEKDEIQSFKAGRSARLRTFKYLAELEKDIILESTRNLIYCSVCNLETCSLAMLAESTRY